MSYQKIKRYDVMCLSQIIKPHEIYYDECSKSKTALFAKICQCLSNAESTCQEKELFDAFIERERLGSTAIGNGIALPHIRSEHALENQCCFVKLKQGIDFGAEDQRPVDVIIALIVPEQKVNEHLHTLAAIARQFQSQELLEKIRHAENLEQLQQAVISDEFAAA